MIANCISRLARACFGGPSQSPHTSPVATARLPEVKRPTLEALEPRLLLSGSLSAEFVSVDNSAQLTGYNTFDYVATTDGFYIEASLRLTLTQGTIYQDPNGSDRSSVNPQKLDLYPTVAFDTGVGPLNGYPNIISDARGFDPGGGYDSGYQSSSPLYKKGSSYYRFDTTEIDIATHHQSLKASGIEGIARITLSDDAEGVWSIRLKGSYRDLVHNDIGTITAGTFTSTLPPSTQPQAVDGDFTGDGISDVFWHNKRTGENAVWDLKRGGQGKTTIAVRRLRNTDWKLAGTGDLTGDGKNDILWRNAADGRNAVWEMDGTTFVTNHLIRKRGNTDWRIVGVGDFTGDGKQDILWRNTRRGRNSIWEMDGLTLDNKTEIASLHSQNWQVAGVADFTDDGKDDIIWQNTRDQRNVVWKMDRTSFDSSIALEHVMPKGWQIGGIGSYSRSDLTDIFWRNTQTGANDTWPLDGSTTLGSYGYQVVDQTDQDWQPAGSLFGL